MKFLNDLKNSLNLINNSNSLMPQNVIDEINKGGLPNIRISNIVLAKNEFCCYADNASTTKSKEKTVGYEGVSGGFNIRIMKGLSYRTGKTAGNPIKQKIETKYDGYLILTNKRIVFLSNGAGFDKKLNSITAITPYSNGLNIQIGQNNYTITVKTSSVFMKAFQTIKENPNIKLGDSLPTACPKCGTKTDSKFCPNCGTKLE